ncbi:hypothetical protein Tco_0859799 [Tanacetum coccineum]|uniref:Integrase, catalytic region, zinc finger, CCHC-type, peptidase aspartic, catalytic n=1 Tax=Tanacetum coccineum TaxID=301880 RepID=A0ABQ5BG45_9ASTR
MLPEWGRFVTAMKLNRGLRESNYDQLYAYLKQHEAHANENKMDVRRFTQSQLILSPDVHVTLRRQARQENRVALDEEQLLFLAGGQDNAVDKDVDEKLVQDLALNVDNVFQADDCDAFDSDVDEAPIAQTMFMANLSSTDPVYNETGPLYDLDILSEVHGHDHYQDVVCEHHEEHEMHDDVQPNYVVYSHADYTSNSNVDFPLMISIVKTRDVFHVATNSELNVSSFTEMHDAHTSLKARCLELEVELSNLRDKIQKDNHDEVIKQRFSFNLEENREVHLVYLKHLKESVETLREIVEEAKVERPLDSSLASACRYTKHS